MAHGRRTLTFVEHVREIERVGRGERDPFVRLSVATQAPQLLDGLGSSANCSPPSGSTESPPRISPRALRAAIDRQQLAPGRRDASRGRSLRQITP
jgi:hypothetical protein